METNDTPLEHVTPLFYITIPENISLQLEENNNQRDVLGSPQVSSTEKSIPFEEPLLTTSVVRERSISFDDPEIPIQSLSPLIEGNDPLGEIVDCLELNDDPLVNEINTENNEITFNALLSEEVSHYTENNEITFNDLLFEDHSQFDDNNKENEPPVEPIHGFNKFLEKNPYNMEPLIFQQCKKKIKKWMAKINSIFFFPQALMFWCPYIRINGSTLNKFQNRKEYVIDKKDLEEVKHFHIYNLFFFSFFSSDIVDPSKEKVEMICNFLFFLIRLPPPPQHMKLSSQRKFICRSSFIQEFPESILWVNYIMEFLFLAADPTITVNLLENLLGLPYSTFCHFLMKKKKIVGPEISPFVLMENLLWYLHYKAQSYKLFSMHYCNLLKK